MIASWKLTPRGASFQLAYDTATYQLGSRLAPVSPANADDARAIVAFPKAKGDYLFLHGVLNDGTVNYVHRLQVC